jgi:membrane protein implicated in regulation of membrane protease activity
MDALGVFYSAHPFWVWLALGAAFLTIEVLTGSGWLLWPAGSAAVVALLTLTPLHIGAPGEWIVFTACTVVTTFVGRRWLRGVPHAGPNINDASARLIGHRGETSHAFEAGLGRVFVDGKEWSAELDGGTVLAAGAKVVVVAVEGGARLKVRAV